MENLTETNALRTGRFKDAPWFNPGIDVIIGGQGGIGSWLSLFLGRQECNLILFDPDIFSEENLAGQFCNSNVLDKNKAESIKEILIDNGFCNDNLSITIFEEYNDKSLSGSIVFSCFDNMKARKIMFDKWCNYKNKKLFIDGRLLSENYAVYAVTPDKIEDYKKELYDDSEIDDAPCTFKSTTHCSAMIAANMTSLFNNYIANELTKENIRVIPFKTTMELSSMIFDIKF